MADMFLRHSGPGYQVRMSPDDCGYRSPEAPALAAELDAMLRAAGPLPGQLTVAISGCLNACPGPFAADLAAVGVVEIAPVAGRCDGCGRCLTFCRPQALALVAGAPVIDQARCLGCSRCERKCPRGALTITRRAWRIVVGGKPGPDSAARCGLDWCDASTVRRVFTVMVDLWRDEGRGASPAEVLKRFGREGLQSRLDATFGGDK